MVNKITPTEKQAYTSLTEEDVDVMEAEREAYIQERYRDTIAYPIEQRKTTVDKIIDYIMSWFR